jgi:hypothetical protein
MSVMQTLEGLGDRDKNRIYGEAIDNLKGLKLPMRFYTPKGYHVFVIGKCDKGWPEVIFTGTIDPSAVQADCTILVIPADLASHDVPPDGVGAANKLIVIINKM